MNSPQQQALLDQQDALCREEPIHDGIRRELLRLEALGTAGGIDPRHPEPSVFQLVANGDTVHALTLSAMTSVVRGIMAVTDSYDINAAMARLANVLLLPLREGDDPAGLLGRHLNLLAADPMHAALHEHDLPAGCQTVGLGVSTQLMGMHMDSREARELMRAGAGPASWSNSPAARPLWFSFVVTNHGWIWTVCRMQEEAPLYGAAGPDDPGLDTPLVGPLSRVLDAMINN